MASFDDLPTVRPKKKVVSRNITVAPRPQKPLFEFNRPEDTPRGGRYRKTSDGFVASASCGTWIMAVLMGGISVLLAVMVWRARDMENAPSGFFYSIGGLSVVAFIFFLYFSLGRVKVVACGNKVSIGRRVLGIGLPRMFKLDKIERMRMRSRSGYRVLGFIGKGSFGWIQGTTLKDQVCEIETDTRIWTFGAHLRAEHLYYMRYLIMNRIQEMKRGSNG